jgi:hypothetical protein
VECDPDEIIPLSDYIVHRSYNCSGLGSKKWMWVRIVQRNEDCSIIRITEWETDTADWIYMYEESDFTEFFRWPEDTVRYIKTYDWP